MKKLRTHKNLSVISISDVHGTYICSEFVIKVLEMCSLAPSYLSVH